MDMRSRYTTASFKDYLRKYKANLRGIDLNANFPASFLSMPGHSSAMGYAGRAALSEPETRAVAKYIESNRFACVINFHATGSLLYYTSSNPMSIKMANAIGRLTGYEKRKDEGKNGRFLTYTDALGIPGITIEVGTSQAPISNKQIDQAFEENALVFETIAALVKNKSTQSK